MFRSVLLSLIAILFCFTIVGQTSINWLTWEEALEKNKVEKKKFLVDVHTEWCSWCKKMDARTFQKELIASFVNEHFYAIKFDAEQKEDIIYDNKVYSYVSGFGKRGYHELAQEIMNGRMSYPTVVFIDSNLDVIQPIPGFQDPRTFEIIINYFAGDYHTTTPWHRYEENFRTGHPYSEPIISPKMVQPAVQPVKNN